MSIQIKKKFLRSRSVDGSKVLFLNEDSFKALKYDGSEVELFKINSSNEFRLLEIPKVSYDPTVDDDLARKKYVDDSIEVATSAREAANEYLQEQLDTEKARAMAAEAAETAARVAADLLEINARVAADEAEAATREAEDIRIRLDFAAEDASRLLESKQYTDLEISKEKQRAKTEEDNIRLDFASADLSEKTQREAADQSLRDDLDSEISTRASEDVRVLSESKAYADVEKARAMAAESAEATTRASEDVRVLSESKAYTDEEKTRAMASEASEATTRASEDSRILSESKAYTDVEKTRAMAAEAAEAATRASEDTRILSESKAYTDSSIAAVIDYAPEAYDTLKEIAEYISSDQSATTQILSQIYDHETRLDIIEGTGEGSVYKAEADAKAYTDAETVRAMAVEAELQHDIDEEAITRASEDVRVLSESKAYTDVEKARAMAAEAAEAATRASEDVRVLSEAKTYTDAEKTRAMSREDELQNEIDAEEILRASEDVRVLSESKAYTDAEKARAMAAEASEAATRASEDARVLSESKAYTDEEKTRAMAAEASEAATRASEDVRVLSESKEYTDVEKARAMAAEAAESATRASEDARVLSESKTYTDTKVANVVGAAPYLLDTLQELAAALGNDENFATSVTNYISMAKQEAKDYSKDLVDNLGNRFAKDAYDVNFTILSAGYVELSYKAFQDSIVFTVDRLMLLEQEDYTVSVVDGKTRLTFIGSILQGGDEALAGGDKLRVRYLKDVRP